MVAPEPAFDGATESSARPIPRPPAGSTSPGNTSSAFCARRYAMALRHPNTTRDEFSPHFVLSGPRASRNLTAMYWASGINYFAALWLRASPFVLRFAERNPLLMASDV